MKGYYNDPDATAEAFRGGWFHSGDAAVVHPDGYVEIRDRFKDVIISGGENISSIEVEGVLLRHPAVLEVGRGRHAAREVGRGAARVRRAAARRRPQPSQELREFCREHLAHFKVPQTFNFVSGAAEDGHRQDPEVRAAQTSAVRSAGSRRNSSSNPGNAEPAAANR